MLKKVKWLLLIVGVIVLCIGGYILYELKIKTYDVADTEVDKLVEETFEVELPDGTVIQIDKDGHVAEKDKSIATSTSSGTNDSTNQASDSSSETSGSTSQASDSSNEEENSSAIDGGASDQVDSQTSENPENSNTKKVTVADIKEKYEKTFKMLESQVNERLNALISQGMSEYQAKKSNGESISYGYFYQKYMGAATTIEAATDTAVNGVVRIVENDLAANGYDKSYAQSFKTDYEATKKATRSEMMDKALNFR